MSAAAHPEAGRHPRRRRGHAAASGHLEGAEAGRAGRGAALRRLHPRQPRPSRRRARRLLDRLSGRGDRARDRRRRGLRRRGRVRRRGGAARAPPAPSPTATALLDDGPFFVFNGDVLSDVDLTALAAHARREGRHGDHLPDPGRRPAPLRPRRAARRRLRRELPREAGRVGGPGAHQRRRLRARARGARHDPARPAVLDRARRVPEAGRRAARSTGTWITATGATSARRRATWRRTSTCSSGRCDTPSPSDARRAVPVHRADGRHRRRGARVVPPVLRRRPASASAPAPVSGRWPSSAPAPWSTRARRSSRAVVQSGVVIGAARPGRAQHPRARARSIGAGTQRQRRRPRRRLRRRRRQPARRRDLPLPRTPCCPTAPSSSATQLARQGGHMTIPDGIFKAYDVRGLYPQEIDEAVAERIGCALAQQLGATRLGVGMDPRPSSPGSPRPSPPAPPAAGAAIVDFGLVAHRDAVLRRRRRAGSTAAPWSRPRTTRRSTTA